jgi:hypothetical protein
MAAAFAVASAFAGGTCVAAQNNGPTSAVPLAGGWTARFFVSPTTRDTGLPDDAVIRRNTALGVNAQLSRRIARDTRLSVDLTNLFDRDSSVQQGLVPPADGRGLRIQLKKTF